MRGKIILGVVGLISSLVAGPAAYAEIRVTPEMAEKVGHRIWKNECAGTVAGLTSWNGGEAFASLGIGHCIWYPAGMRGPFDESFPALIEFLSKSGVAVEAWMRGPCPWTSRAQFQAESKSTRMRALRTLLSETVPQQAQFLAQRLQAALPKMLAAAPAAERGNIRTRFEALGSSAQGLYALIDYVNFKGEGVLPTERYNGQGWGLLQVLEGMKGTPEGASAVKEFARSAKETLARRVQNAPANRGETRWLNGWTNRIATYL